jgi:hypothetical protein
LMCILTVLTCVLWGWYAWFSFEAPFELHELHSFDPVVAADEIKQHQIQAPLSFACTIAFLLSLPIIHTISARHTRTPASR